MNWLKALKMTIHRLRATRLRRSRCAGIVLLALALSACRTETHVHFDLDQQWEVNNRVEFDIDSAREFTEAGTDIAASILDLPSGLGKLASALMGNETLTKLAFDQMALAFESNGIETSWRDRSVGDNRRYDFTFNSRGYEKLPQVIGALAIIEPTSEGYVRMTMTIPSDMAILNALVDQEFSVSGNRIISSNADRVIGGRAFWEGPIESIQVVVEPGTPAPVGLIAGLVGAGLGVGALAAMASLVARRSSRLKAGHWGDAKWGVEKPGSKRKWGRKKDTDEWES